MNASRENRAFYAMAIWLLFGLVGLVAHVHAFVWTSIICAQIWAAARLVCSEERR